MSSYTVLARKWRPSTFDKVVGQATVVRTLQNALASGRIGHAFLLSGARGVGKTTTARILAKALNCSKGEGPTAEPCGECPSCLEIAAGTSLDVQEIDGATNNSVEQVRELRESARYNPARDRFKVWIIDEVHMLSTGAFNALLKTLEEPPPRVKFIFATTEYHKLPDTILSRCQQYDFRMVPAREIQAHLREVAGGEGITVSDETLGQLARAAEGSVRDALSLFDQVLAFSGDEVKDEDVSALLGLVDRELLLGASKAVLEGDNLALLELVDRLAEYGSDYRNFTRELLLHVRELLLVKIAPADSRLLAQVLPEERERLQPLARAFSEEDLLRALDVLTRLDADLRWSQDPRVTLELALLKLAQLRRLVPFAELVARVEGLASGAPLPPPAPRPAALSAPRPAAPAADPVTAPAPPARRAAGPRAAERTSPRPAEPPPSPEVGLPPAAGDAASLLASMLAQAQSRPTLVQPLRGATATWSGDTVRMEVPTDFVFLATTHADEYNELARKVLGRPVKVVVVAAEPAAAAPSPAQERSRKLAEEAGREVAVQETLELFGGRVVDVRETPAEEGK